MGGVEATGLWRKCPRCGRMGEVFIDKGMSAPGTPMFVVEWQRKGWVKASRDRMVSTQDLFGPTFGCGYDKVPKRANTP